MAGVLCSHVCLLWTTSLDHWCGGILGLAQEVGRIVQRSTIVCVGAEGRLEVKEQESSEVLLIKRRRGNQGEVNTGQHGEGVAIPS
eukprot:767684-Hanusia_phi.AAC.6